MTHGQANIRRSAKRLNTSSIATLPRRCVAGHDKGT